MHVKYPALIITLWRSGTKYVLKSIVFATCRYCVYVCVNDSDTLPWTSMWSVIKVYGWDYIKMLCGVQCVTFDIHSGHYRFTVERARYAFASNTGESDHSPHRVSLFEEVAAVRGSNVAAAVSEPLWTRHAPGRLATPTELAGRPTPRISALEGASHSPLGCSLCGSNQASEM